MLRDWTSECLLCPCVSELMCHGFVTISHVLPRQSEHADVLLYAWLEDMMGCGRQCREGAWCVPQYRRRFSVRTHVYRTIIHVLRTYVRT